MLVTQYESICDRCGKRVPHRHSMRPKSWGVVEVIGKEWSEGRKELCEECLAIVRAALKPISPGGETADAPASKAGALEGHEGSNPSPGTKDPA